MSDENDYIKRYLEGRMTPSERHALEKRALSDPFLADALEGSEFIRSNEFSEDIVDLSEKINQKKIRWMTPLRIAASVILLVTSASLIYYFRSGETATMLAKQETMTGGLADSIGTKMPDSSSTMLALAKEEIREEKRALTSQPKREIISSSEKNPLKQTPGMAAGATGEAEPTVQKEKLTESVESKLAETKTSDQISDLKTEDSSKDKEAEIVSPDRKKQSPSERASPSQATLADQILSGKVTAADDGTPLPGVNIVVTGTTAGTVTDPRGNYSIALPSGSTSLTYSYVGMETREMNPLGKSKLDVQLNEDAAQLSEIVVRGQSFGAGAREELPTPVIRLATPVGGIRAYNKYLENNIHYPPEALEKKVKGKVTITFTVTTSGSLTDFEVVRGLGYGCDEEVIRLVQEGPAWTPSVEDDSPVESEVRVKLKFDPEKAKN